MKRSIKSITGFTMGATDGEIGKVKEFYFDDETWTIRYLIVDTGNWLSGRVVLISPDAVLTPDWENEIFPVNLSKDQVKNSPDIDTVLPVSRQEEMVAYWGGGYYGGAEPLGVGPGMPLTKPVNLAAKKKTGDNEHLRSTKKITGYTVKATDGKIGDVEDFIFDDTNWKIEFMLIDTGHWLPGKKVPLSPHNIKEIDWETATVEIDTTVAHVKDSPAYDPQKELTEVYTLALHNHYNSD